MKCLRHLLLAFCILTSLVLAAPANAAIWYVNDTSTTGDSFTQAIGYDTNNGSTPSTPKRTLNALEGLFGEGDTIFVDAGFYYENDTFTIDTNGVFLIGKDSASTVVRFDINTGGGMRAIYATNVTNLTLRNLRLTNGYHGVWWKNVDSSTIDRVSSDTNGGYGIYLDTGAGSGSDSNMIKNSAASGNSSGIYLNYSRNNTLTSNTFLGHSYGIYLSYSSNNTLTSNTSSGNSLYGIVLITSGNNNLTSNTVSGNSLEGIHLANSSNNNTLTSNTVSGNSSGIFVANSSNNTLTSNTSSENSNDGINLSSSSNNLLTSNTSSGNSSGIYLSSSSNNLLTANTSSGNSSYGIYFGTSSINNKLMQNTFDSNASWGIYLASSSSAETVTKNVIKGGAANPDSGIFNATTTGFKYDFGRNWWGTTDSSAIKAKIGGTTTAHRDSIDYQPFRLAIVDTAPGADTVAPRAPDTVGAVGIDSTSVHLTWAASLGSEEPESATTVGGYRVYRSKTADTSYWARVADLSASTTSFTDSQLATGETYYYRVTAYDAKTPFENEAFYSDSIAGVRVPITDTSGPNVWYVNDTSLAGDVYTTAIGNDANDGLSPSTPKRTLNDVDFRLTAGDTVYVDAGWFYENDTVTIAVSGVFLIGKDSASTVVRFDTTVAGTARGIYANGRTNLTLRNFGVTNARNGIWFKDVDLSVIEWVRSDTNGVNGIYLDSSAGSGSDSNTIKSSAALGNSNFGIHLYSSSNNTLTSNTSSGNSNYGIYLDASSNNALTSNTFSGNSSFGIHLYSSSNNALNSNTSTENSSIGIYLFFSSNNTLISNTSSGNSDYGIFLSVSSNNTLILNTTSGNSPNSVGGLYLNSSNSNTLISNTSSGNSGFGIRLSVSNNNTLIQNTVDSNGSWGFYIDENSSADAFAKNLHIPSQWLPDYGVYNAATAGVKFDFRRNWWGTTDSAGIKAKIHGVSQAHRDSITYTPFRLGIVDTAPGADTVAPNAPDTVAATSDSASVAVSWSASSGAEESESVTTIGGYRVYRSRTADTSYWARIGEVSSSSLSFTDTDVTFGETYFYRVTTYDAKIPFENEAFYSDSIASARVGSESTSPLAFSLLAPAAGTETRALTVAFSWQAALDSSSVTYRLIVDTDLVGNFLIDSTTTATSLAETLPRSDTYLWRVIATDTWGNSRTAGDSSFLIETTPPSIPALLFPANNSETGLLTIAFRWSSVSESQSGLNRYRIQIDSAGFFLSPQADSFTALDTGATITLPGSDTYRWRVIAYDDAGNTSVSLPGTFVIRSSLIETTPPAAFTLTGPSDGIETRSTAINFSWNLTTDTGSGIAGYTLQVDTSGTFILLVVNSTLSSTTDSSLITLDGTETYHWRVIATDLSGNTTATTPRSFLIDTAPPASPIALKPDFGLETNVTTIAFSWSLGIDNHSGIASHRFQLSHQANFSPISFDSSVGSAIASTLTLAADTWYWRVVAQDDAGNTSASTARRLVIDTLAPGVPLLGGNSTSGTTRDTKVFFFWSGSGADSFSVQVSNSALFDSILIDTVTAGGTTNLVLLIAPVETTYHWRVIARDLAGNTTVSSSSSSFIFKKNRPPFLTSTLADTRLHSGESLVLSIAVSDSDGDSIIYILDSAPAGLIFDTVGRMIRWTAAGLGRETILFRIGDGFDTLAETIVVTINDTPTMTFPDWKDTTIFAGRSISVAIGVVDTFFTTRRFSITTSAPGAAIDSSTGVLSWTPAPGGRGVFEIRIGLYDGIETGFDTYRITVLDVDETNSIVTGQNSVTPNGAETAAVVVTVRDQFGSPMPGYSITLLSNRGSLDTITALAAVSDELGRAFFWFRTALSGLADLSARIDSSGIILRDTHAVIARTTGNWWVSPGGSDNNSGVDSSVPFKTIAKAIAVASGGDRINLMEGTHTEKSVDVNKNDLTIIGVSVDSVIISPTKSGVGFDISKVSGVRLRNVTIKGSSHGIKIQNSDNIAIQGNKILDNSATGIWVHSSERLTIANNFIDNPGTARNATGIYFKGSSGNCVVSNTVKNHRLGGIILVREDASHVMSNAVHLDNVPGNGAPPFNKSSLIVYGEKNIVQYNNLFNQTQNRSQFYLDQQTNVANNFEILGTNPAVVIDEIGYVLASNDTGVAYCDVDGDDIADNDRALFSIGYFGSSSPFSVDSVANSLPVVSNLRVNGETAGSAKQFDTSVYVVQWNYADSNGDTQVNIEVAVSGESQFASPLFHTARYQSGDTYEIFMKPKGVFYVRVRANDGKGWSDSIVGAFVTRETPSVPQGVAASGGAKSILIGWGQNLESNLGGYKIYRSSSSSGAYSLVATVGAADSRQYYDTNVSIGETKYYVVRAFDTLTPPLLSDSSVVVSAAGKSPISGITIDGCFTGWKEHGVNEWEQVGSVQTPGRLSKVYFYSDSEYLYIATDFLVTTFIDGIKNNPTLVNWYNRNKKNVFNYFEFKDESIINDPTKNANVVVINRSRYRRFLYVDPITRKRTYLSHPYRGSTRNWVYSNENPANFEWSYPAVTYVRVWGDGRIELSPNLKGGKSQAATGECATPNDSRLHRVYEIKVPLSQVGNSSFGKPKFDRFKASIYDCDFPGLRTFLDQAGVGGQGGVSAMSTDQAARFERAVGKLESLGDKTNMSLAAQSSAVAALSDHDVNALMPEGWDWFDGDVQLSPAGDVVTDQNAWVAETKPIESTFSQNTPPLAKVRSETIYVSPGGQVTLDGSLSADSEGAFLEYLWTQKLGDTLALSDSKNSKPTITIPAAGSLSANAVSAMATGQTSYSFELVVSDRIHNSVEVTVNLIIVSGNSKPSASLVQKTAFGAVGETITLKGFGSDPNGDALSYSWDTMSGGSISALSFSDSVLNFIPSKPGKYLIAFKVTDSGSLHALDTVTVYVSESVPSLSSGVAHKLSNALSDDTSVAVMKLTDRTPITVRFDLMEKTETTPTTLGVQLAAGFENSNLVIGRPDSALRRMGLDNLPNYDSFTKFLVEFDLLNESGVSVGSLTNAFSSVDLEFNPEKTSLPTEFRSKKMTIFTFDEAESKWVAVKGVTQSEDGTRIKVTTKLEHFSLYILGPAGGAQANLNAYSVYPNPWKPNDGDANTGREFDGTANSGITFINLPDQVQLKIFTIRGAPVIDFATHASGGSIQWDVRNDRNVPVASGWYFYSIRDLATGQTVMGKLAVVR